MRRSDLNDVVTLHYLNGNCSWKFVSNLGGLPVEANAGESPQIQLKGRELASSFQVKCVVDGKVRLNATITGYGERLNPTANYIHPGYF